MSYRLLLLAMTLPFFACGADKAPSGSLTYCSYSKAGSAGLGKKYCELIADPGTTPKVVVALNIGNRFGDPEIREEFPVDAAVVDSLQTGLKDLKFYKLDGYNVDEAMTGGYAYRIYAEYSSGEKINARWYGHNIKDSAILTYNWLERFFEPWRRAAIERNRRILGCIFSVERPGGAGKDVCELVCRNEMVPFVSINLDVDNTRSKPEVHKQFDLKDNELLEQLQKDLRELKVKALGDTGADITPGAGEVYFDIVFQYYRGETQHLKWTSGKESPQLKALRKRLSGFFSDANESN